MRGSGESQGLCFLMESKKGALKWVFSGLRGVWSVFGGLVKAARPPTPGGKTTEVQGLCQNSSGTFYNLPLSS